MMFEEIKSTMKKDSLSPADAEFAVALVDPLIEKGRYLQALRILNFYRTLAPITRHNEVYERRDLVRAKLESMYGLIETSDSLMAVEIAREACCLYDAKAPEP